MEKIVPRQIKMINKLKKNKLKLLTRTPKIQLFFSCVYLWNEEEVDRQFLIWRTFFLSKKEINLYFFSVSFEQLINDTGDDDGSDDDEEMEDVCDCVILLTNSYFHCSCWCCLSYNRINYIPTCLGQAKQSKAINILHYYYYNMCVTFVHK